LPGRANRVLGELRSAGLYPPLDPPILNQQGGRVTNGFQAAFRAPRGGTIYFSMDGSDPRLPGGNLALSAIRYTSAGQNSIPAIRPGERAGAGPRLEKNTIIKCRTLKGEQWSALNEAFFQVGSTPVGPDDIEITELSLGLEKEGF